MPADDRIATLAAAMLDFRRCRSQLLPSELFAEPAWDLMLELFIADAEGRRITARQVVERSHIPPTVMSRWLMHLSKCGLVVGDGSGDLDDLLTMSGPTLTHMESLLEHARTMQPADR